MIVYKAMVEQAKLHREMKQMGDHMSVLKRCGLDKEYKKMLPQYNAIVSKIKKLDGVVREQQRKSAQALLVCFVAADLATLAADYFQDVCNEVNFGLNKADNDFVRLMKFNAESSAKRWNEVVQLFDKGADNFNLSMFYAEFSEAITDKVLPMIKDAVWEAMTNTEQGRKWL